MKITIENYPLPLKSPFAITGHTFTTSDTVRVTLEDSGFIGRGESIGIYYNNENAASIIAQLEQVSESITSGITSGRCEKCLGLCSVGS